MYFTGEVTIIGEEGASLTLNSESSCGIATSHSLTIQNLTLTTNTFNEAIAYNDVTDSDSDVFTFDNVKATFNDGKSDNNYGGIYSSNADVIIKNSTFSIEASDDFAIYSEKIEINNSTIDAKSESGIHGNSDVLISESKITLEAVEGASDDMVSGLWSDKSLVINDSVVSLRNFKLGISASTLTMTGSQVKVSGSLLGISVDDADVSECELDLECTLCGITAETTIALTDSVVNVAGGMVGIYAVGELSVTRGYVKAVWDKALAVGLKPIQPVPKANNPNNGNVPNSAAIIADSVKLTEAVITQGSIEDEDEVIVIQGEYIVTWKDDEGNELSQSTVLYGEKPEYDGEEPTKDGYKFTGWDKEFIEATGAMEYKAVFEEVEDEPKPEEDKKDEESKPDDDKKEDTSKPDDNKKDDTSTTPSTGDKNDTANAATGDAMNLVVVAILAVLALGGFAATKKARQ